MTKGRPTKYDPSLNKKVFKLSLLGATDKELADFLDISEATVHNWKKEYPEFLESIKSGKIEADAKVANSLYKKALGYKRKEVKIFQYDGEPVIVPFVAYYPPDTAAINIWLKNRRGNVDPATGQKWADKQTIDGTVVAYNVEVTKEEAKRIAKDLEDDV